MSILGDTSRTKREKDAFEKIRVKDGIEIVDQVKDCVSPPIIYKQLVHLVNEQLHKVLLLRPPPRLLPPVRRLPSPHPIRVPLRERLVDQYHPGHERQVEDEGPRPPVLNTEKDCFLLVV